MLGTIALILVGAVLATLGVIGLLDATRGTPVSRVTARGESSTPAVEDPVFRHLMEAYTGVPLRAGHEVAVLANGDGTFPRLLEDLRAARRFIAFQMYYWKAGRVSDMVREALVERARAGVEVLVLHDAMGAKLPREYVDALQAAGVQVAKFRAFRPHELHTFLHRAHLRAVVVDGVIGYTGGFGVDDKWLGDGRRESDWRDTNVRFTGPAVSQLMATFATCWAEATGDLLAGRRHWETGAYAVEPVPASEDAPVAGLLHGTPTVGSTPAERFVALAIAGARRRLWMTTPYFVADDDFRRLVKEAVGRGVDVRILTAGDHSDVKSTRWAAHARYEELLERGVRIYEYEPSMIHAKTIVADGAFATVGTMNLDNRSMAFNNECTFLAFDRRFAEELERLFADDLTRAEEFELARFRRRAAWRRVVEHGAHLMSRVL
jgi:cardiolipin synthase